MFRIAVSEVFFPFFLHLNYKVIPNVQPILIIQETGILVGELVELRKPRNGFHDSHI